MRLALLCAATLLAAPAIADELVASNGSDSVRLSDAQCSNAKVLQHIDPSMHPQLKNATAQIEGQSFNACWVVNGKVAHLVYEDGDQGIVPLLEFKKAV